MNIHIHVHYHGKPEDIELLQNVFTLTKSIHTKLNEMTPELQRLTDEVSEMKSVTQSAATLLGSLSQLIRDNANNPAALNALADDIDSSNKQLADAITANTPATEEPQPGGPGGTGEQPTV
jgi:hypothetical protein